jgi:hypothetical protein
MSTRELLERKSSLDSNHVKTAVTVKLEESLEK